MLIAASDKKYGMRIEISEKSTAEELLDEPVEFTIRMLIELKKRKNMSMDDLKTSYISLIEMYIKEISKINYDLDDIDNVIDLDSRR